MQKNRIIKREKKNLSATVMGQRESLVLIVGIGAALYHVGVVAAPVLGLHVAQLGVRVPPRTDVIAPAHVGRIAVERAGLPTGVAPSLRIVETHVEDARLAQVLTLAHRVVHDGGIDLGLELPGSDAHL